MIRYIWQEYVHKTLLSARFIVVVSSLLLIMIMLFQGMSVQMKKMGYQVGVFEMLPSFLFYNTGTIIYFGVFLFLIAVLPRWDGSMNEILRLGKRKWFFAQYIYIFFTSVIYFLIWTGGFILALFPRIIWNNEWSSLAKMAIDPQQSVFFWMNLNLNVNLQFSDLIMNIGSPGKVYLLTFMLTVLGSFFIGIFMITVNICFRRGVGTVLAYLMVGVQTMSGILAMLFGKNLIHFEGYKQVKNLLERMQYYISPLYQSDLFTMAIHNARPIAQRIGIGVIYFAILILLVTLFGMCMIRKIDLCKENA